MTTPIQAPTIKTSRLLLRQLSNDDAEGLLAFLSIPDVVKYTKRTPFETTSQVRTFLSDRISGPTTHNFAVTLLSTGTIIGILGCANYPDIGYIFHPGYGKQGYATEALQAFMQSLWTVMPSAPSACSTSDGSAALGGAEVTEGYDFSRAFVDVGNVASQRLLERCGWTRGEVLERDYESPQLGIRDAVVFRIARPGMKLEDVMAVDGDVDGPPPVPDIQ